MYTNLNKQNIIDKRHLLELLISAQERIGFFLLKLQYVLILRVIHVFI